MEGFCHRSLLAPLLCCACWAAAAAPALAQTSDMQTPLPARVIESPGLMIAVDSPDLEQQRQQVIQWIEAFRAWKKWNAQWRNRIEPGFFGVKERRARPDPPEWLFHQCADLEQGDLLFEDACRLLVEWGDDDAAAQIRQQTAAARLVPEAPPEKTKWWERVHLDTLWVMPQPGARIYGVIGVHATIEIAGRLEMFVTPGAMLMNLPSARGDREWKPATHWGFALRLMDFRFPGAQRRATLHANLAKAYVLGGPTALGKTTLDLAGLSLSFKRE